MIKFIKQLFSKRESISVKVISEFNNGNGAIVNLRFTEKQFPDAVYKIMTQSFHSALRGDKTTIEVNND